MRACVRACVRAAHLQMVDEALSYNVAPQRLQEHNLLCKVSTLTVTEESMVSG